ncbi:hypothetical protein ILUMI_05063 [Ignelater luminosus]|uniref:Uncharacterized protein n=1 Tax=Ignelater luminosus TaxID=2038154 RepID=A0A8K0GIG6_IGNLU|nr:hypothetical protein ILUMI_05063 [Ignelater luminosus]
MDEANNMVADTDSKFTLWKRYLQDLFSQSITLDVEESEPIIIEDEVTTAIKAAKSGKATGPDKVSAEMIKLHDDKSIKLLTRLLNGIYRTVIIPTEWLTFTFITLPKIKNAKTT